MNRIKCAVVLIGLLSILLVGCTNGLNINNSKTNEMKEELNIAQSIFVQKRVGSEHNYEYLKEINDAEQIRKVNNILDSIKWEAKKVNMVRPPDYKFIIKYTHSNSPIMMLWISPNQDQIEIVISNESKYAQLDQATSSILFEILTDCKLSDVK